MATVTELGQAGLQGWREKVANGISRPVADRAPLKEEQVRAVVGAVFFVLSVSGVCSVMQSARSKSSSSSTFSTPRSRARSGLRNGA